MRKEGDFSQKIEEGVWGPRAEMKGEIERKCGRERGGGLEEAQSKRERRAGVGQSMGRAGAGEKQAKEGREVGGWGGKGAGVNEDFPTDGNFFLFLG